MSSNPGNSGAPAAGSPASGATPLAIQKLTQGYSPFEDRISLDAQSADGRVLRLWLTRRLADTLFGHLGGMVSARAAKKDESFARHLQVWEQQAAQSQMRNDEPVRWQGDSVLVAGFDIGRVGSNKKGARVIFKASMAGMVHPVATLSLEEVHLRQWIGLVFRIYGTARWPRDVWPQWLIDAQRKAADAEASRGDPA
ncbi:MAG: hypothetical protein FGM40_07295 [Rhodocyclaceae bacterium]|nr:hypothetical protein [Rhodocyclaceae bacterium]